MENGKTALVGEGGGTNINLRQFTKISDTEVEISDLLEPTIAVPREERASTWDRFIGRIAAPLARQAAKLGKDGRPVSIGLSIGQPNRNNDHSKGEDNLVSQRAREILIQRGQLKREDNKPILERRTGEHAPARLAAAVEILAELGLIDVPNPAAVTDAILTEAKNNPAFVSDIVMGKFPPLVLGAETKQIMQGLAQGLRDQEAQIYGIQLAVMTEASGAPKPEDTIRITGVEGSAFNLGVVGESAKDNDAEVLTNKGYTEAVSADEGEAVTVFKSSGLTGIGVATLVKAT